MCPQGCGHDGYAPQDPGPEPRGDPSALQGRAPDARHHGGLWAHAEEDLQVRLLRRPGEVWVLDGRVRICVAGEEEEEEEKERGKSGVRNTTGWPNHSWVLSSCVARANTWNCLVFSNTVVWCFRSAPGKWLQCFRSCFVLFFNVWSGTNPFLWAPFTYKALVLVLHWLKIVWRAVRECWRECACAVYFVSCYQFAACHPHVKDLLW